MVTKIPVPEDDSVDVVNRTIDEKVHYRAFYNRIKPDLISQIEQYRNKKGNPEFIAPMSIRSYTDSDDEASRRKISLLGLYKPESHKLPFEQLEKLRRKNGLVICPSCGEAGRPRTLDHYLPKDVFPELSITLLNLTPMCDWCQGEKGTEYMTVKGEKMYIHPYFDEVNIPLYRILFDQPYSSPIINYSVNSELSAEIQRLVNDHLDGIGFFVRFKEYFQTKYRSILRRAMESRNDGGIELRNKLNVLLDMASDTGINSWDAVLYRSVLEDENLLDYLENKKLPDNL